MKLRILCSTAAAGLLCASAGLAAQPAEGEADSAFNPELVDSLFGDAPGTAAGEADAGNGIGIDGEPMPDAGADANADDDVSEAETPGEAGGEEDAADPEEEPGPTDLDRAYATYGQCIGEAAVALDEAGFAADQVGEEAVLRCSAARSAYVNAFYFSLLPRYPGESEQGVRAVAERLVRQTDAHLAAHALEQGRAAAAHSAQPADDVAEPEEGELVDEVAPADAARTYDSPADVFAGSAQQDVQMAQQGRRVTVVATRAVLEDDSVAGEEESVVLELDDDGLWHELERSMRYQCARGANAGEWTTELCP